MKEAVEKIITSLVSEPDAVEVDEIADGRNVRIEVRVADSDMGRIIGREGLAPADNLLDVFSDPYVVCLNREK